MLGWTTVAKKEDAERIASQLVAAGAAACVQVEGPITSTYRWEGAVETTSEYRLLIKFLPEELSRVTGWLAANHPYDTPEWVVTRAEFVSEKYLSWARANSSSAPL